ncbi:hypothetical protein GCM10027074_13650 [Streptomyces deserti]
MLRQTCDPAEERDMAEQGSTMLLDSLSAFLAEGAGGLKPSLPKYGHAD